MTTFTSENVQNIVQLNIRSTGGNIFSGGGAERKIFSLAKYSLCSSPFKTASYHDEPILHRPNRGCCPWCRRARLPFAAKYGILFIGNRQAVCFRGIEPSAPCTLMPPDLMKLERFRKESTKRIENYPFGNADSTPVVIDPGLESFRRNVITDRYLLRQAYCTVELLGDAEKFQFQNLAKTLLRSSLGSVRGCFSSPVDPLSNPKDLLYFDTAMEKATNERSVLLVVDVYGKGKSPDSFEFAQQFLVDSKCPLITFKDTFYCLKDFKEQLYMSAESEMTNSSTDIATQPNSLNELPDESSGKQQQNLNPLVHLIDPFVLKKSCKSGFLFINGKTFCNDSRFEDSVDYSAPIISWIQEREERRNRFPNVSSVAMENFCFEDFDWMLNHPNILVHHGDCKHLVVIREIRCSTVTPKNQIGLMVQRKIKKRRCLICDSCPAYWITFDDKYSPVNPCFYCDRCYKMFHYDQHGQLTCNDFEVYRYFHDD